MQFPWPGNIPQLKRVLTELILSAKNPYIAKADVARTLQNEIFDAPQKFSYNIHLDRPLKAINQEIVQLVLSEERMNHSRAASRLGISRTTLWRMLKEADVDRKPDE
jgi:DNA-binding NtrC family response regulator